MKIKHFCGLDPSCSCINLYRSRSVLRTGRIDAPKSPRGSLNFDFFLFRFVNVHTAETLCDDFMHNPYKFNLI